MTAAIFAFVDERDPIGSIQALERDTGRTAVLDGSRIRLVQGHGTPYSGPVPIPGVAQPVILTPHMDAMEAVAFAKYAARYLDAMDRGLADINARTDDLIRNPNPPDGAA